MSDSPSEETMDGVFIDIEFDQPAASDPGLAKELEEICTVGIFKATDSGTEIVKGQLDECVLCYFCEKAAPDNSLRIIKKYEN